MIAGVVVLHIWALHVPGNNNPTGVEVKGKQDTVPFHPVLHDQGLVRHGRVPGRLRLVRLLHAELSRPSGQLHPGQPAEDAGAYRAGMVLPAVLRDPARHPEQARSACSRCSASIAVLFFVPWLDTSKVRSATYRPIYRQFFWLFVLDCIGLGYLGSQPPEGGYVIAARISPPTTSSTSWSSCRCSA